MRHHPSYRSVLFILLLSALAATPLAWGGGPDPTPQATQGGYVGADTCKMCHEDVFNRVQRSPHWNNLLTADGQQAHVCETCHGPGAEHVNGGGDVSKIFRFQGAAPAEINQRCLACHSSKLESAGFSQSPHSRQEVSCISCHSPHDAKQRRGLLREPQAALCTTCHTEVKADFSKPFRHRVNEGLIQCTDCHSPHGSSNAHLVRSSDDNDQVCFKCHRNLQGPFVFEHVPVKTEGCMACHQPHGSVNARMLKVSNVNITCLQCHTPSATPNTRAGDANTPATPASPVHNQMAKFQSCTICHVYIHGSNADETFMK